MKRTNRSRGATSAPFSRPPRKSNHHGTEDTEFDGCFFVPSGLSGVTFPLVRPRFPPSFGFMKKRTIIARSGRFQGEPAAEVADFSESISFDWRLAVHDIQGSIAHATMLEKIGLLSRKELAGIRRGLEEIGREILAGKFRWKPELEDVHMNIEAELTRRVPAGAKLHTGRSRNDQVALSMRLWLRDAILELGGDIQNLQRALVSLAAANLTVVIPGYTHLQRAQPVYFAHHLLAYAEMLERDLDRLGDGRARLNVCPLGAGALAGSTLPLNREFVAEQLGFVDERGRPQVSRNSMDAVSDRDFVVEFAATAALLAVHLSRLADDLILWSTAEFNFIRIGEAYTTGSSLMPQKRNPDVAELTRGKSARVIGNLVALLTLLKGLPMTYNRDLQEDKERLFDSVDTVGACVRLMAAMLPHTHVNEAACAAAAADPQLLATDLADYLVRKGMPFRQAHHSVGQVVAFAEKAGRALDHLTPEEFHRLEPVFGPDVLEVFSVKRALDRRTLTGATGTREVRRQVERWKKALG